MAGEARGPGRREGSGRPYPPPRRPQPQSLGGASPECLLRGSFPGAPLPPACTHVPRPAPPGAPAPVPRGSARASSPWAPRTPGAHGQGGPEATSQLWRSVGRLARRAQPAPNASYPCLLVSGKTFVAARARPPLLSDVGVKCADLCHLSHLPVQRPGPNRSVGCVYGKTENMFV